MTRRQAREEAFILIFEKQFNDSPLEEILELAIEVRDIKPDDYIKNTFFGVYDNVDNIDKIISENAVGWSINRLSKTALAVLRLSVYEIMFLDEIPSAVSINEAVNLAKKYGDDRSYAFINSVLGKISRSI